VNIAVNARHMEVTDAMRQYVEAKAAKLPRMYHNVQSVEIILDTEADRAFVEVVATATHKNTFVATQKHDDMYACIDQCFDKLTEQLRRHKDKVRNHKGPARPEGRQ